MGRARFDPISLVLGVVFAVAGAIVLAGGDLIDDGAFLLPAGLVGVGVGLLYQVARRSDGDDKSDDDPGSHPTR